MSEPLLGVVVSHATVAEALRQAVASITGIHDALVAVSNEGCDPEALQRRLDQAVSGRPAVLFIDLPAGSCLTTAVRFARGNPNLAVVTGVNLAMLLDFVFRRDVPPGDAAHRAVQAGSVAVKTPAPAR
ncbi:MAG: PTS sugar transporter subunit IIA [Gemmatimonadales bacterium]